MPQQNYVTIPTEQIRPSRFQPRATISPQELSELANSVKRQGVLQPVLVRPIAHGTYELVAGERRWRAAQAIGLREIPAMIKSLTDREALEFALVENVQRQDLNPLEEAKAYERMISEFGYTQETAADTVGKDRATVANSLRLLKLPPEIQQGLRENRITMGHAKALLSVDGTVRQLELFALAIKQRLSVRQLEALASATATLPRRRRRGADAQLSALQDELCRLLGTKVSLAGRRKGGRIVIEYFSNEDLTRVLRILGVASS